MFPNFFPFPNQEQKQESDETELYDRLGVKKTCSKDEINRAFRKLAIKHHPDKGGDPEMFKKIGEAHEILSDDDKRKKYDCGGMESLKSEGGGGVPNFPFGFPFGSLFNRQQQAPTKGEDKVFPFPISLEEMFSGTIKKIRISKQVVCQECKGKGGKESTVCDECRGSGMKVIMRHMGPMIQQIQTVCPKCKGQKEVFSEKNKCIHCKGEKTVLEKKDLSIEIKAGMKDGDQIRLEKECDQTPGIETGDVVVIIQQKPHSLFKRVNEHLLMEKEISLGEALCGGRFSFLHPSGKTMYVELDEIVSPNKILCLVSEGMTSQGHLFIKFSVKFPDHKFTQYQMNELNKIFPPSKQHDLESNSYRRLVHLSLPKNVSDIFSNRE